MPLTEHMGELRKRIIISLLALSVTFIAAFNFSEKIFWGIVFPLKYSVAFSLKNPFINIVPHEKLSQETRLVSLAPAEAFRMHIKVSFIAGRPRYL